MYKTADNNKDYIVMMASSIDEHIPRSYKEVMKDNAWVELMKMELEVIRKWGVF